MFNFGAHKFNIKCSELCMDDHIIIKHKADKCFHFYSIVLLAQEHCQLQHETFCQYFDSKNYFEPC